MTIAVELSYAVEFIV